ncbi:copper resistance CopC/CopD family protein [Mycolicibacterium wolinskyi]|uniref:copper resistance CopC/CopD family protein n=1 Tax=Mycolicibacterium wolinskyi TaxID=59750 RepID=UPI003917B261
MGTGYQHRCTYRTVVWGLVMVAVAVGLLWTAGPASAHASVVRSAPSDGAQLDSSPLVLSFDLNEPVTLVEGSVQVIDVDGTRYPLASPHLEAGHQRIVVQLPETLPDGAYLATARVVSPDTHVVSLSIRFTVGSVTEQGDWSQAGPTSAISRSVLLPIKILVYLGTTGSAGLLLAASWAWPDTLRTPRFRVVYRVSAGLLTVGLIGRFAVLATEQAGALTDISWSAFSTIARTPFGIALVLAAVLAVTTFVRPPSRGHLALTLGYLQAATALIAVTLGGHGGSTNLWPLPFMATVVHVYAIAVWLGGLTLIFVGQSTVRQLRQWHRVAAGHVVVALIAGAVLTTLQVRPVAALFTTSYGIALLVKVGLVAVTIAVGYIAYRSLRTRPAGRTPVVLIETALAVSIIGATSLLSSLTPARDSYTRNVATRLDFGESAVLEVDIDTIRRGSQVVAITKPAAVPDAEVSAELSSTQANVARLPVELREGRSADGTVVWRSSGLIVPAPGRWKMTIRFDDGSGPKLASFFYQVF